MMTRTLKTLPEKVKQHKPRMTLYLTDKTARTHRNTVLRLPVARCKLNPMELAWTSIKGYVAKYNNKHNLPDIEQITPD